MPRPVVKSLTRAPGLHPPGACQHHAARAACDSLGGPVMKPHRFMTFLGTMTVFVCLSIGATANDTNNVTTAAPRKCTATFSIPQATTLTTAVSSIPNVPHYAPIRSDSFLTYYQISSVELSRSNDMVINVALTGGTIKDDYNALEDGITLLPMLSGSDAAADAGDGAADTDETLAAAYATVYDRYLSFGQFATAGAQAATILERLKTALFHKEGGSEVSGNGRFLISAKKIMMGTMLVPADYIDVSADYDSEEGHGIADVVFKKYGRVDTVATPDFMTITLTSFSSYRIANDEYVYLNFFNNMTEPEGCIGGSPIVIHITGFQNTILGEVINMMCFSVLILGLMVMIFGTLVPTSHHVGSVGMLVVSRFAHEDGQPMPFILSPLQAAFGSDKYQYVIGALVANVSLLVLVAIIQVIVVRVLMSKRLPAREAAGVARWPFISVSFFAHFAPQIFFLLGRTLGRISLATMAISSVIVLLMAAVVVAMSKKVLSANDNFGAYLDTSMITSSRYGRALKDRDTAPRPDSFGNVASGEVFGATKLSKDPLVEQIPLLGGMFKTQGEWVARQPVNFLLERWGSLFLPYRKKHWLVIEFGDAMICGLVSVLDNYTSALAMYQYGIFMASKLFMLVLVISWRPALRPLDTGMLFMSYAGQLIASLALFVGSIKAQMLETFSTLKEVSLLFVALVITIHVLLAIFESCRNFYRRVKITNERRRARIAELEQQIYVAEMLEKQQAENDARLNEAVAAEEGEEGGGVGLNNFMHMLMAQAGSSNNLNAGRSQAALEAAAKKRILAMVSENIETGLMESLVEGHLPGSIGARQVLARKMKYDPRHTLPAQDAFVLNQDGSITFEGNYNDYVAGAGIGNVGYDELDESEDEEEIRARWLRESRRKRQEAAAAANRGRSTSVKTTASRGGVSSMDGESTLRVRPRLRELKTNTGTVMVEPVYSTWGLDDNSNSEDDNDSRDDGSGGDDGTASRHSYGRRSMRSSRRPGGGPRSVTNRSSVRDQQQMQQLTTSSEDSDSGYDSEGLPITSVEQRVRKEARRAARAKRRADRQLRMQGGAIDADGDLLGDGFDDMLLDASLRDGGNNNTVGTLDPSASIGGGNSTFNSTLNINSNGVAAAPGTSFLEAELGLDLLPTVRPAGGGMSSQMTPSRSGAMWSSGRGWNSPSSPAVGVGGVGGKPPTGPTSPYFKHKTRHSMATGRSLEYVTRPSSLGDANNGNNTIISSNIPLVPPVAKVGRSINDRQRMLSAASTGIGAATTAAALAARNNSSRSLNNLRSSSVNSVGHESLATSAAAGGLKSFLPVTEEEQRRLDRATRRRERKEQRQLKEGIVTTTANLCQHIPAGGVSIRQFNAFVDSIPNLTHAEKSLHKRRLADRIRTIYRDRAREAANKKIQEEMKRSLELAGLGEEGNATGLSEVRTSRIIADILRKGGVRGISFVGGGGGGAGSGGGSLVDQRTQELMRWKRKHNEAKWGNENGIGEDAKDILGNFIDSSSSSSSDTSSGSSSSDDDGRSTTLTGEVLEGFQGRQSTREHGGESGGSDTQTSYGSDTNTATTRTTRKSRSRAGTAARSVGGTSANTTTTRLSGGGKSHSTISFSTGAGGAATDGDGNAAFDADGNPIRKSRKQLKKERKRAKYTAEDHALQAEINTQRSFNKTVEEVRQGYSRRLQKKAATAGGADGLDDGTASTSTKGGGVNHNWLVLEDAVQANADMYAARILDTGEGDRDAEGDDEVIAAAKRKRRAGKAIDDPEAAKSSAELDEKQARKARQAGMLLAVWEAIGSHAKALASAGEAPLEEMYAGVFGKDRPK